MTNEDILKIDYPEIGNWARHYSTVRMTVTPFLILVSLGVMSYKWDSKELIFMIWSAAIWALNFFLLYYFTYLTKKGELYLRDLRDDCFPSNTLPANTFFHRNAVSPDRIHAFRDPSMLAYVFLTVMYGLACLCWYFRVYKDPI